MHKSVLIAILFFIYSFNTFALSSEVIGPDVMSGKAIKMNAKSAKGLAVIFLSTECPCSNSHIKELVQLKSDFPEFEFVGIHSNMDESAARAKEYFSKLNLPFPVIQDDKAKLADDFKAYKTPHAFLLNNQGKVVYEGGVTNSKNLDRAERKFLREALDDLSHLRAVRTPRGRTLGCEISRS